MMTDARPRSLIRLLVAVLLAALQGLAVMPSIGRAYGRLVGLAMVGFVYLFVAVSSAAATTTPLAGALYSYDSAAPNAQRAVESIPRVTRLMDAPALRDAERRPTNPRLPDFLAAKAGGEAVETGQLHHVISTRIGRELERNPNLAGRYSPRDPRFTTRAVDDAAHRGYQTWHRELDAQVEGWLRANRNATPEQFESFLRARYSQSDLQQRFPNGF